MPANPARPTEEKIMDSNDFIDFIKANSGTFYHLAGSDKAAADASIAWNGNEFVLGFTKAGKTMREIGTFCDYDDARDAAKAEFAKCIAANRG